MFETIFIGTSGLLNHSKGLRVVGNNLANVNTPGFKSAQLQFANLFDQGGGGNHAAEASAASGHGSGVSSLGARVSFRAGLDQTTGNPLDLNINGNGFFAIRRDGGILYTRSGDFRFNSDGILVNSAGDHVLGLGSGGVLEDVTLDSLSRSLPKATSTVKFRDNLSSTIGTPPVDAILAGITVLDAGGIDHPIKLTFKNLGSGEYTVTVTDTAGATLSTASLKFASGFPTAATSLHTFSYAPAGVAAFNVTLDFSTGVTSLVTSTTLGVLSQDGYAAGVKTDQTIGADGIVTAHYSNGQSAAGPRLALANFRSDDDLVQGAGSTFSLSDNGKVQYGYADTADFGKLVAGHREGSNVDLAEEFSNLILMQRGYQASSHVISTANDMIQQLFDMKGNR